MFNYRWSTANTLYRKILKKEKKMKKLTSKLDLLKAEKDVLINKINTLGVTETERYVLVYIDTTPSIILNDKFIELFGTKNFIKVASVKVGDAEKEFTKEELKNCIIKGTSRGYFKVKEKK